MANPFPDLNLLGAGYNIFNKYADPQSSTYPLLDLGENTQTVSISGHDFVLPATVRAVNISRGSIETTYGKSISEYQTNLAVSAGLSGRYGFFTASVRSSFSNEEFSSALTEFTTLNDLVMAFQLSLPPVDQILGQKLLRQSFVDDLNTLEPHAVFQKYGTHWVAELVNGGRGTYHASVSTLAGRSSQQIKADVEAAYKSITGSVDAKTSTDHLSKDDYSKTYKSSDVTIVGGDPSKTSAALNGRWEEWESTVLGNPVLIDFTPKSLQPVWLLCEDRARARALEDAYPEYAAQFPAVSDPGQMVLTGDFTQSYQRRWRDKGSGADKDVSLFHPKPRPGYFALGSVAVSGYPDQPSFATLTVKPSSDLALAEPRDYERIYDDKGSGSDDDGSVWRPIPPDGFVALGDVVQSGYDKPSTNDVRCVNSALVRTALVGSQVWNDKGSGGNTDGSIWAVMATEGGVVPQGLFLAQKGYNQPSGSLAKQVVGIYVQV